VTKDLSPGVIRKYGPSLALAGGAAYLAGAFDPPDPEDFDTKDKYLKKFAEFKQANPSFEGNPEKYTLALRPPAYLDPRGRQITPSPVGFHGGEAVVANGGPVFLANGGPVFSSPRFAAPTSGARFDIPYPGTSFRPPTAGGFTSSYPSTFQSDYDRPADYTPTETTSTNPFFDPNKHRVALYDSGFSFPRTTLTQPPDPIVNNPTIGSGQRLSGVDLRLPGQSDGAPLDGGVAQGSPPTEFAWLDAMVPPTPAEQLGKTALSSIFDAVAFPLGTIGRGLEVNSLHGLLTEQANIIGKDPPSFFDALAHSLGKSYFTEEENAEAAQFSGLDEHHQEGMPTGLGMGNLAPLSIPEFEAAIEQAQAEVSQEDEAVAEAAGMSGGWGPDDDISEGEFGSGGWGGGEDADVSEGEEGEDADVTDTWAAGGFIDESYRPGMYGQRARALVEGPGTERSDEIPARLSDGEFVLTARSVRGADPTGQGDRYRGAQNLYEIMRNFEMRA